MKFFKETLVRPTAESTSGNPAQKIGAELKERMRPEISNQLATLDTVAQTLGVSKRYVQKLVQRKAIPVIRLGKRCPRFDLNRVLAAVKRFEVDEINLR
jgi:excisionase family DNA binding protein